MSAFDYPGAPHQRRHGPEGYAHHEQFRPWLRDEFSFRCVFCLTRERWVKGPYGFHVDHLEPQSKAPNRALDYENLLYTCSTCDKFKANAAGLPDPCDTAYGKCLKVSKDGIIQALDSQGALLIKVLGLDNEFNTAYRRRQMRITRMAQESDRALYVGLMGFPDELPVLESLSPRVNSRPDGIQQSCHAKRRRGELEETY